jgi:ribosomal protein L40E
MTDLAVWLDGNALAGHLVEVFGTEMTTVQRVCQSCGARNPVGAHRAYPGASAVLRCPACSDLALRITTLPDRYIVQLSGTWNLDLPRDQ